MPQDNLHKALFIVPPKVQLLDISGPIHTFYEAKMYGASIESHFLSLTNGTSESSAGLHLADLQPFEKFSTNENDWIIIPGLESDLIFSQEFEQNNQRFYDWLNVQYDRGCRICSVCTGAYLLAQSGILEGKRCTTHWKYITDFRKRFPGIHLHDDRLFVKDQHIYSSAGVASGIDLSLFLLEETFGSVFASQIAKEIVIFLRRTEKDPQLSIFLQFRNHIENRIHQVQDYLAQHLDQKVKVEDLAELVHMSPRNLTRLFKKTTGITIGFYIEKLRAERAFRLIAQGNKLEAVSLSCGLNSTNQLRNVLKKHVNEHDAQPKYGETNRHDGLVAKLISATDTDMDS